MSKENEGFIDPPHSGWSIVFHTIGTLMLLFPVALIVYELVNGMSMADLWQALADMLYLPSVLYFIGYIVIALQFFFIGHLVQLVCDIRNFLRDISRKS